MAQEHTHYPETHAGWLYVVPTVPPDIVTADELADFRSRYSRLTPTPRRVLRDRAMGMSIPEIEAAEFMTNQNVRNLLTVAIRELGLNTLSMFGRVPRACYLMGRVDAEER